MAKGYKPIIKIKKLYPVHVCTKWENLNRFKHKVWISTDFSQPVSNMTVSLIVHFLCETDKMQTLPYFHINPKLSAALNPLPFTQSFSNYDFMMKTL